MGLQFATLGMTVAVATVIAAGLMRGFAGFGSGMLMAPIFAVVFGPVDTVAMITLLELFVSIQLMPGALHEADWHFVAPLGVSAALLMPVGAYVLRSADPNLLARVIAGIVLVFVIVLMTGRRYQGEHKLVPTLGIGAASGILMAATSMGNPPVLLYVLSGPDSAAKIRANIIAYFAGTCPGSA